MEQILIQSSYTSFNEVPYLTCSNGRYKRSGRSLLGLKSEANGEVP